MASRKTRARSGEARAKGAVDPVEIADLKTSNLGGIRYSRDLAEELRVCY